MASATWHRQVHTGPVPATPALAAEYHSINVGHYPGQHNPSVVAVGDDLHVVVRSYVDYQTTNIFARITENWSVVDIRQQGPWRPGWQIEDLRLFMWQGKMWAVAALHRGGNMPEKIEQCLLEFWENDSQGRAHLHVQPAFNGRIEKNWMPVVGDDNALRFIYALDPFAVLPAIVPGEHVTAGHFTSSTGYVRGGTPLVPFEDGYIAIVHEVFRPDLDDPRANPLLGFFPPKLRDPVAGDEPTVYLHRFVKFSKDLKQHGYSNRFHFKHVGIEFCPGLTRWRDKLVASFGVNADQAWLAVFDDDIVQRYWG